MNQYKMDRIGMAEEIQTGRRDIGGEEKRKNA